MVNSKKLSSEDIRKGQEKIKEEIYARAKELGISTDDLWPLPDGVFNIEGYCQSSPRIMWILKQPYDDMKEGDTIDVVMNQHVDYNGKEYPIASLPENLMSIIQAGGLVKAMRKLNGLED